MGTPAVIVDMDGTVVDVSGIRHYVLDNPDVRNFDKFHRAASYVDPMPMVAEVVRALHKKGLASLVLTSRKEQWRYRAKVWLRKWDVPVDALGMRADADTRRDDDVKRDLYIRARRLGFDPVLALDDNPLVIQLWRSLDIPTVVVPGWITPPRSK
jgi:beta-phosphoglucomutase-like phosphatase (HAD superfamily)